MTQKKPQRRRRGAHAALYRDLEKLIAGTRDRHADEAYTRTKEQEDKRLTPRNRVSEIVLTALLAEHDLAARTRGQLIADPRLSVLPKQIEDWVKAKLKQIGVENGASHKSD